MWNIFSFGGLLKHFYSEFALKSGVSWSNKFIKLCLTEAQACN